MLPWGGGSSGGLTACGRIRSTGVRVFYISDLDVNVLLQGEPWMELVSWGCCRLELCK